MGRSKSWPKSKAVSFEDLVQPVVDAIKFAYKLERKNKGKTIPWKGYDIDEEMKVTSHSPHKALSSSSLTFDEEDQGREALEVIIGIAIQTGITQGRNNPSAVVRHDILVCEITNRARGGGKELR